MAVTKQARLGGKVNIIFYPPVGRKLISKTPHAHNAFQTARERDWEVRREETDESLTSPPHLQLTVIGLWARCYTLQDPWTCLAGMPRQASGRDWHLNGASMGKRFR